MRFLRKARVGVCLLLSTVVMLLLAPTQAHAVLVNCLSPHCYSIARMNTGNFYTGLKGEWRAVNMTPGVTSPTLQWFTTSEMWWANSSGSEWIEEGLANDWEPVYNNSAYTAFWADKNAAGGYWEHIIEATVPNGTNRVFQISRSSVSPRYDIWYQGHIVGLASATNFWSSNKADLGGEFYNNSAYAMADTFYMTSAVIDNANNYQLWPAQYGTVHSGFNGVSYTQSQWSWNKPL